MILATATLESILVYDLPPVATAAGAIIAAWIAARSAKRNERKLHSIDRAVNGAAAHESTLRETTQAIAQRVGVDVPGGQEYDGPDPEPKDPRA